jgi:hypothetical protein
VVSRYARSWFWASRADWDDVEISGSLRGDSYAVQPVPVIRTGVVFVRDRKTGRVRPVRKKLL